MRFIRNVVYILFGFILLALIALYFVAQTSMAAAWMTQWINNNTPYQLAVSQLNYRITEPLTFTFNDVELRQKGQAPLFNAQKVTLQLMLSPLSLHIPTHFASIELENGAITLSPATTTTLMLSSERLQLRNMAMTIETPSIALQGEHINGGMIHWALNDIRLPDNDAHFEFSAKMLNVNGIETHNALIQGDIANEQIIFHSIGADLANGQLTGNGRRDADGHWFITTLRLSDVKYQSEQTLSDFINKMNALTHQANITLNRLDLLNANLQGENWALNDLSLSIKNIALEHGRWQATSGSVQVNAFDLVFGDMHFTHPVISLGLESDRIQIKQFSSRWQDGLIRASGVWLRDEQTLTLNDVALASLRYTLPHDWLTQLNQPAPDWLRALYIEKWAVDRTLLIDINPNFPFQFSTIESRGTQLQLIKQRQFGLWNGQLSVNAAHATVNKIDLRHPSITLNATADSIDITEIGAFTPTGLLEGKATVGQQPNRPLRLSVAGRAVAVDLFQHWGWQAIPLQGDGNVDLQLSGDLLDPQTNAPKLQGRLTVTNDAGESLTQSPQSERDADNDISSSSSELTFESIENSPEPSLL